ncbi:MAG: LPS assembly lipoprotein LptE [Candidatus Kapabacteria bacterium]|nr:LPS assembly lipoprotein LptE [Candidatus Kapabacteria bacterium]
MMKNVSYNLHESHTVEHLLLFVALVVLAVVVTGCYSFRGGSVPEHIHTMSVASVIDRSGFGDPAFREFCTETLVRRFRSDNSVQLVEDNGDARLSSVLTRVQDQIVTVQSGDLENQRRIVVAVEAEYFDAVKNKVVWKKTFENFDVYNVADATEGRRLAAERALRRIADDILLASVSDW